MTIRYSNGFSFEAILLSRSEEVLRVAIAGSDEVVELTQINGAWISEDCEPVAGGIRVDAADAVQSRRQWKIASARTSWRRG